MATTTAPDTNEIRRRGRRRLVGAIVIVLLLVVFVPMILDSEPRPPSRPEPAMAIPPKDTAPALPPPAPAIEKPVSEPVKAVEPAPEPPKAVEAAKPAPEPPRPKPAPAPPAATKLEGFAIQVGAFKDEAKLKQARDKLVAAGIVHYTERLEQGGLTRLRAGPFPTREAADAKLAKTRAIAPDAKIVPLP